MFTQPFKHISVQCLSDTYEVSRRLGDSYETSRRLSEAYGHIYKKKKIILVIFGKFKKRNPRVVGFFRRILDQNVVVPFASSADMDRIFFFSLGTKKTSFIFTEFLEPIL